MSWNKSRWRHYSTILISVCVCVLWTTHTSGHRKHWPTTKWQEMQPSNSGDYEQKSNPWNGAKSVCEWSWDMYFPQSEQAMKNHSANPEFIDMIAQLKKRRCHTVSSFDPSPMFFTGLPTVLAHNILVSGWATPLKNDGVRQLGWLEFPNINGKIQNWWQPVTTNQIYDCVVAWSPGSEFAAPALLFDPLTKKNFLTKPGPNSSCLSHDSPSRTHLNTTLHRKVYIDYSMFSWSIHYLYIYIITIGSCLDEVTISIIHYCNDNNIS